jgi:hypothetical protein
MPQSPSAEPRTPDDINTSENQPANSTYIYQYLTSVYQAAGIQCRTDTSEPDQVALEILNRPPHGLSSSANYTTTNTTHPRQFQ